MKMNHEIMKRIIRISDFMVLYRTLQPVFYRSTFLLIIKLQKLSRIFLETDEWGR